MESSLLKGIKGVRYGFGTFNEPVSPFARQNWSLRPLKTQVHGTRIAVATAQKQQAGEADGWFTTQKNVLLTLANADCYPVLFARKDGQAIAALHVGWRGALHGIIFKLRDIVLANGDDLKNWTAVIGPGARPCCYQVSEDLIHQFCSTYSLESKNISPAFRMLDIPAVIAAQLKSVGLTDYEDCGLCTICTPAQHAGSTFQPEFHSYRRDHNKDVQFSAIMMV